MKRTLRRGLIAAIVPVAAAITLAACSNAGTGGMPGMDHGSMSSPAASADHSTAHSIVDVEFAQMMIAHHQQALDMARLAETRATDSEIKSLAAHIKNAQRPEITAMTGWLAAWGQPTAQPGGHNMPGMGAMPGMMSDEEMAQLSQATGTDFDRQFARMMIAHHNGAIQMANDIAGKTTNATVKAFAQQVVTAQTAEVDQLQKILDRL